VAYPQSCKIALKEWAVAVRALDRGRQVVLLRKGGIREEGKEFRVIYPQFLLYPTFEHQNEALLKPEAHEELRRTIAEAPGPDQVTFTHWAQVEEVIELTEQERLDRMEACHIWTNDYAQKRLHWKPRKPLAVMLIRVYRMEHPVTRPVLPEYSGCKSWVELDREVPLSGLTPVLSDAEFQGRVRQVKEALGLVPSGAAADLPGAGGDA